MNRKKRYVVLVVILFALLPILFAGNSPDQPKVDRQDFRDSMRNLWEDHSRLTRLFITSVVSGQPDPREITQKLHQNQTEISAVFTSFYGEEVGDQLARLLTEHSQISATMLQSASKADALAFEESVERWYDNADKIAQFLHDTNTENWPLRKTKPMMREYLDLTLEEALARWSGDFAEEEDAYKKVQDHAREIADMLSQGIINKFRHKFR
ncbi:MAG TPA: hypothetical protein VJM08_05595 [Anaerolineales bacterium]|nr:hypothetical protein [Anaerolineales bacterium]